MNTNVSVIKFLSVVIVLLQLAACGGGSEEKSTPVPPEATNPPVTPPVVVTPPVTPPVVVNPPVTPPVVVVPPTPPKQDLRFFDVAVPAEQINDAVIQDESQTYLSMSDLQIWSDGRRSVLYFDFAKIKSAMPSTDRPLFIKIQTSQGVYENIVMPSAIMNSSRAISVNSQTTFVLELLLKKTNMIRANDDIKPAMLFLQMIDRNEDGTVDYTDLSYYDGIYSQSSKVLQLIAEQKELQDRAGDDSGLWPTIESDFAQSRQIWPFFVVSKQSSYHSLKILPEVGSEEDGFILLNAECAVVSDSFRKVIPANDTFEVPNNCSLSHALCGNPDGTECARPRQLFLYKEVWSQYAPLEKEKLLMNLDSLLQDSQFKEKYAGIIATTKDADPVMLKNIRICWLLKENGQQCNETALKGL